MAIRPKSKPKTDDDVVCRGTTREQGSVQIDFRQLAPPRAPDEDFPHATFANYEVGRPPHNSGAQSRSDCGPAKADRRRLRKKSVHFLSPNSSQIHNRFPYFVFLRFLRSAKTESIKSAVRARGGPKRTVGATETPWLAQISTGSRPLALERLWLPGKIT